MSRTSTVQLKALGINSTPNELASPPGGMKTASNVVITRDNIIEPRRGYKTYSTTFGSSSDRAKQLFEYRQRVLTHYNNVLLFDTEVLNTDGKSIMSAFPQSISEVEAGLRIKSAQANGNLYLTTNQGIKKISAASAASLSTTSITPAGGINALNINTRLSVTPGNSTGFFPTDSTVAYRTLWLKKDANQNLVRGVPSARTVIYNDLGQMVIRDMMRVLAALDSLNTTGSLVTNGNYVDSLKLPLTALSTQVYTNLVALSAKLDKERGTLVPAVNISSATITAGVCTITFTAGLRVARLFQAGDSIYLNNFTGASINGVQTVVAVSGSGGATPTITFLTQATGSITVTSATIESGWFRAIPQPATPAVPATHADNAALQTYLQKIIIELQSTRNLTTVAQFGASSGLAITNVSGSGVTVTVTTGSSDDRDYVATGDLIFLSGPFTGISPSILGLQTVSASASTTFSFTSAGTGTYTGSSSDLVQRVLRFTDALKTTYITPLGITTTANVFVDVTVPSSLVDSTTFFQIYRSNTLQASTTDVLSNLTPDDEMRLVYEAFPTAAQVSAGTLTVLDQTPDAFFQGGAYLYTNSITGEGIAQANYSPPLAKDISFFQNTMFFANTKTLQRANLTLLGVSNILADYQAGKAPAVTIGDTNYASEYKFVPGVAQVVSISCGNVSTISTSAYMTINGAGNLDQFGVWFDKTGSDTSPVPSNLTAVRINVSGVSSASSVSQLLSNALSVYVDDFIVSVNTSSAVVTVTNTGQGVTASPTIVQGLASPWSVSVTTTGAGENALPEITTITCVAGNLYQTAGTADYFTLNTPFSRQMYFFWFNVAGGGMIAPVVAGATGVSVGISASDTSTQVAAALAAAISTVGTFTTTSTNNVVVATTTQKGPTVDATNHVANGGFSVAITQRGALNVLLSTSSSPTVAVDQTAKSLVNIINKDFISDVNAYYVSGPTDVPGKISFEAKNFLIPTYYVVTNASASGNSFSPSLAPTSIGFTNTAANPTVITLTSHGLVTGDNVFLGNSNSTPPINGVYQVTVLSSSQFTVPVQVLTSGSAGVLIKVSDAFASDNEVKPNRIYFAKFQQPEAVPLLNYFDVGDPDKAILRIFPLRQSLFVFKEEGLYRVSGTTAPYSVDIFDWSVKIVCPDSLATANNFLFCYSRKGISLVSENGADVVSKQIYNRIISLNSTNYQHFTTASWGVGYESDYSYMFFTVVNTSDSVATIVYRYSTLTGSWTTFDVSDTCGIVKTNGDKLYLGSGTKNVIRQERKDYSRTDYADDETVFSVSSQNYLADGQTVGLSFVNGVQVGDVFLQIQTVSTYQFNRLLQKLDIDPGVAPAYTITNASTAANILTLTLSSSPGSFIFPNDYVTVSGVNPVVLNATYQVVSVSANQVVVSFTPLASPISTTYVSGGTLKYSYTTSQRIGYGVNLRAAIVALAAKLDLDPGLTAHNYSASVRDYSALNVSTSPGSVTTVSSTSHGLLSGRYVTVTGSTTTPNIDGQYAVTVVDANTFTLPVATIGAGTLSWGTLVTDPIDYQACYNIIVSQLNADQGPTFSNYLPVSGTTSLECVISAVDTLTKRVTLSVPNLGFTSGIITIYSSYLGEVEYLPVTLDNYLSFKQFSEAQLLVVDKSFTNCMLGFASDLVPSFTYTTFTGTGPGLFGNDVYGENYFGGSGLSAPFITYIPKNNQKCRFLRVDFQHRVARESFGILGVTLTGRVISTRAYR